MSSPPALDHATHLTLTGYLTMHNNGRQDDLFVPLLESFPWIVELAYNSDEKQTTQFRETMVARVEQLPELFGLRKAGDEFGLAKEVIDHFNAKRVANYLASEWGTDTVESMWSTGVAAAMVFRSKDDEELKITTQLMIELLTLKFLREWDIKIQEKPMKKTRFATATAGCNLFWSIMHYYKMIGGDFDETMHVRHWGSAWFNKAFAAVQASDRMKAPRALLCKYVAECQVTLSVRRGIVEKHDALMQTLRASIISSGNISCTRDMIREIQRSNEMQLLLRGIPMPPFDTAVPLRMLDKLEQEKRLMEFIDWDTVDISPIRAPVVRAVMVESAPPPHLILSQVKAIKSELIAIQALASECVAEFQNLVLDAVLRVVSEVKSIIPDQIVQLTIELQATRYDQHRLMVRRVVKRVREMRSLVGAEMLPFSVEQHRGHAVQAMRKRASGVAKGIQDLVKEANRIEELIHRYRTEEAALLDQYTHAERKRVFLAAAPSFLPVAMCEREVDCGLCLTTLHWDQDKGIRLVTCCREYGYMCGACMLEPHPHPIESDVEAVRIVIGVRRALGFE